MASLTEMGKAMSPRKFEIENPITLEELYEKLSARAAAFKHPFEIKGGITGKHIAFKKDKELDIIIHIHVKENEIKVSPILQENQTGVSVGGFSMRTDKNSVFNKGVQGVMDLPMQRGAYTDEVVETVKKILAGEEVADFVHPVVEVKAPEPTKSWTITLILLLLLGGIGVHRFYVGKVGTGILYMFTGALFGIGWLVDFIKILTGKFTDKQGQPLKK